MTRRVLAPVLLAALGVGACAGAARLHRADLVGTRWREVCPDPAIATAYVRLDADGHMAWSYEHPDSARVEAVHRWTVEDGALLLQWNNGSATTRYVAGDRADRLTGVASTFCLDGPWIERLD